MRSQLDARLVRRCVSFRGTPAIEEELYAMVITQGVIQPKRRPWRHCEPGPSAIWVEIASVSQTGQSGPDGSLREQLFIAAPSSSTQPEPSSGRRDGCWEDGSRRFDSRRS